MTRGSYGAIITFSSLLLFFWGIADVVLFFALVSHRIGPDSPLARMLRVQWISSGILTAVVGIALFHLPSLLRRGEYQALRITNFCLFFLLILTAWHGYQYPALNLVQRISLGVFGFCSLLLLIAVVQVRRRLRLPRL